MCIIVDDRECLRSSVVLSQDPEIKSLYYRDEVASTWPPG
jgi:hypothetical protein